MGRGRRLLKGSVSVPGVGFVAIQFVPVPRTNPPVETVVPAPPEVQAVLRRACFDCHSNETRWPWYAHVAPVSWLVTHDVNHARGHVNFSTWNRRKPEGQQRVLREVHEQVEAGDMPLWYYAPLHREARLSDEDKKLLLRSEERRVGKEV